MSSRHRQRGVSLSGLIFWCVLLGGAALVAMKLFPLYNEKMKVDFAIEGNWTKADIVKAIMKQFEVSDVDRWSTSEFSKLLLVTPATDGGGRSMSLYYEIRGPLCCDLDVVLNYGKDVELPKGALE
jgi:hypothetical protein